MGAVPSPFDCFLVLRGVKTLPVRMERHCKTALALASWLEGQPEVERVYYPGLASHPQHALGKTQMRGFGGMISFVIKGGLPAARALLEAVRIFVCAESLGGVESLIEHPALMTHGSIPKRDTRGDRHRRRPDPDQRGPRGRVRPARRPGPGPKAAAAD